MSTTRPGRARRSCTSCSTGGRPSRSTARRLTRRQEHSCSSGRSRGARRPGTEPSSLSATPVDPLVRLAGVAPTARTVPSPVALRRDSGPTNTSVPGRRVKRLAVDLEGRPPVEHDVQLLLARPGLVVLIDQRAVLAWAVGVDSECLDPRYSRTGISLPRRSMSSRCATCQFGLSFIRSPPYSARRSESDRNRRQASPDDRGQPGTLTLPRRAALRTPLPRARGAALESFGDAERAVEHDEIEPVPVHRDRAEADAEVERLPERIERLRVRSSEQRGEKAMPRSAP